MRSPARRDDHRLQAFLAAAAIVAVMSLYGEGVLKNGLIAIPLFLPVLGLLLVRRARSWLQPLVLVLTAVCLTLSAVDLILRPFLSGRLHYTPTNIVSRSFPPLPIVARWDANVHFELESYGDLAAQAGDPSLREPRSIVFETDARGFRNRAVTSPVNVIVLGDSFAAGAGTTQDKIYADLLRIQHHREVYNLGYPGGPYDQFINLAIESPSLPLGPHPRVVWSFYTGNDLDDAGGQTWDLEKLPWRSGLGQWKVRYRTFRNRSPLNQWMEALRHRMRKRPHDVLVRKWADGRPVLFQGRHEYWGRRTRAQVEAHPNFAKLERTMRAMKEFIDANGLTLTILVFPTKGQVYRWVLDEREPQEDDKEPSGFAQAVLGACERVGFRCIDTKPYLIEEAHRLSPSGRLLWWRDDTHFGEAAHESIARLIDAQGLTRER